MLEKSIDRFLDRSRIKELIRSESDCPHRVLGAHIVDGRMLIQVFIPTARDITVRLTSTGKQYRMEQIDEAGYFAAVIPRKTLTEYTLLVFYDNGSLSEIYDPYAFGTLLTESDLKKFEAGTHYTIYEKMGAHPTVVKGVPGVHFAVWAPSALRVSVVGDFNAWDGRRHQMTRLGTSGIFDIFVPELKKGALYKFEIKFSNGDPVLKIDPYAASFELRPNTASIVWDMNEFRWSDEDWMRKRAETYRREAPVSIYELHLGSWKRKEFQKDDLGRLIPGTEFYNYRELAVELAAYCRRLGYTHVELMPVMEHPLDASWGYQVTGYYAPTSRFGTPDDFKYFMDYMHRQGIGVILDWVPAHFPKDSWGLACYDGTGLYEHQDPRQGSSPSWGTLLYNYGRSGVSNFLIANALFWAECYHADGIRFNAVDAMLYLNYGKNPGEWVSNIYGGRENLEAVEFLKHLNSVFKRRKDGALLIAEESTAWPKLTADFTAGGLGFDYKWNTGWQKDFLAYMQCAPADRHQLYNTKLVFSMVYGYSETYLLAFSHEEAAHGRGTMLTRMPGETESERFANLRSAYGFMLGHPGKKLLFMGQEFGQPGEWKEEEGLSWELLDVLPHRRLQEYCRELNLIYRSYPALYVKDDHPDGFEWVNCMDSERNVVAFLRKADRPEDTLLFLCNFSAELYEKYQVGVPFAGKYKEILCSDAGKFGGTGRGNPRLKRSREAECDGRENSITVQLPPLSVCIFTCTPLLQESGRQKGTAGKRAAGTKAASNINKRVKAVRAADK